MRRRGALAVYGFGPDFLVRYTAMAIGSALILGFHLTEKFQRTGKSISISVLEALAYLLRLDQGLHLYQSGQEQATGLPQSFHHMFLAGLWHGAGIIRL